MIALNSIAKTQRLKIASKQPLGVRPLSPKESRTLTYTSPQRRALDTKYYE